MKALIRTTLLGAVFAAAVAAPLGGISGSSLINPGASFDDDHGVLYASMFSGGVARMVVP